MLTADPIFSDRRKRLDSYVAMATAYT